MPSPYVSIIIPILNEEQYIEKHFARFQHQFIQDQCLHDQRFHDQRLHEKGFEEYDGCEIIFVDGGSKDRTVDVLLKCGFRVLNSDAGRAHQMNVGAQHASGKYLLFVHVDTLLPKGFGSALFIHEKVEWGFFRIALDNPRWIFSLIAAGINFRSRIFRVATGDQCIFVLAEIFWKISGYKELALMEDIEISRRLKKMASPKIITKCVTTSARRWEDRGVMKTILLMWSLQLAFKLGVSTNKIRDWYR